MTRFSANLGFLWPDRPLLERIDAAAAAGFRAVELHWPYAVDAEQVRQRCAAHGVELLGINTAVGGQEGDFGLGAVPGRQGEFLEDFGNVADYARRAGASSIHVMAGVVAPDGKAKAAQVFLGNLQSAAAIAPDLTLLLEPINQRDRPGYFYSRLAEAADLIEKAGVANLKLMFDVYHVGVSEGDVLGRLALHMPMVGHVQIAAVPSRAEPDEGEIDYRSVFSTLQGLGYSGWIGCEYKPRAETDDGLVWTRKLGVLL